LDFPFFANSLFFTPPIQLVVLQADFKTFKDACRFGLGVTGAIVPQSPPTFPFFLRHVLVVSHTQLFPLPQDFKWQIPASLLFFFSFQIAPRLSGNPHFGGSFYASRHFDRPFFLSCIPGLYSLTNPPVLRYQELNPFFPVGAEHLALLIFESIVLVFFVRSPAVNEFFLSILSFGWIATLSRFPRSTDRGKLLLRREYVIYCGTPYELSDLYVFRVFVAAAWLSL